MKKILFIGLLLCQVFVNQQINAQENKSNSEKIAELKQNREQVINQEKEALKQDVININVKLNKGEITVEQADKLKLESADKRALNIENKTAIIDNSIALLARGETNEINEEDGKGVNYKLIFFDFPNEGSIVALKDYNKPKKFDKRTFSNLVVAFGFNNAIIEGQSFDNSPYKVGKSKFYEMGWVWSTRLLENSNTVRFRYGFSFTFNGLNPTNNHYFVQDGDDTYLEEYPINLDKSKLRMDNLVVPIHFEFGPSKKIERDTYFRYSTERKFKFGIGGYAGFNMGTRQKLKYSENGDKQKDKFKQSYNTANFIYGLSSYIGADDYSFYVKYDLNTIFNSPNTKENNISFGVRFDL